MILLPTGSEERTPSPGQQPRVTTAAGQVEPSAKRPAEERHEGADGPPQKQARRITPIASAPAENALDAAAAVGQPTGVPNLERGAAAAEGLATGVNNFARDPTAGEKDEVRKGPRRITPVASAPVVESAFLGGMGEGALGRDENTVLTAKPSANPSANAQKRVVPLSIVEHAAKAGPEPAASLKPLVNPQAVTLPPKRIALVAVPISDTAGGTEAKKRRITPLTVPAGEDSKGLKEAVKQTPTIPKPQTSDPDRGTTEIPKPVRRITPSPSPPVEDASLTTPVKGRSADVSDRQASPAAKASPASAGASPDASGVRSAKPIRRISPSPCKPAAGLEELARSASVEIARALSVEPADSHEK